jgi:hypothetical protein
VQGTKYKISKIAGWYKVQNKRNCLEKIFSQSLRGSRGVGVLAQVDLELGGTENGRRAMKISEKNDQSVEKYE